MNGVPATNNAACRFCAVAFYGPAVFLCLVVARQLRRRVEVAGSEKAGQRSLAILRRKQTSAGRALHGRRTVNVRLREIQHHGRRSNDRLTTHLEQRWSQTSKDRRTLADHTLSSFTVTRTPGSKGRSIRASCHCGGGGSTRIAKHVVRVETEAGARELAGKPIGITFHEQGKKAKRTKQ